MGGDPRRLGIRWSWPRGITQERSRLAGLSRRIISTYLFVRVVVRDAGPEDGGVDGIRPGVLEEAIQVGIPYLILDLCEDLFNLGEYIGTAVRGRPLFRILVLAGGKGRMTLNGVGVVGGANTRRNSGSSCAVNEDDDEDNDEDEEEDDDEMTLHDGGGG